MKELEGNINSEATLMQELQLSQVNLIFIL